MSATLLNPPFIMIWSSLHGQKSSSQDEIEYVELEKMAAACMLFIYLMPSGVWFGLVFFWFGGHMVAVSLANNASNAFLSPLVSLHSHTHSRVSSAPALVTPHQPPSSQLNKDK